MPTPAFPYSRRQKPNTQSYSNQSLSPSIKGTGPDTVNVLWIEATGNYACIHTASDSHLLRETLAHLEEKLAPHHFIRVRKSAIVNSARISEIRPMFDGVYDILLAEGTVVTSSRRYAHKLRALLES